MKRLGKSVSIIIALLILVFSVLSVFGFSYYEGDNKITVFKGFGSLDWGIDVNGGSKIVLKAASEDEACDLHSVADVIEERAVLYGMTDYEIFVNDSTEELTFVVPESVNSDYSASEVASFLTGYGELTIRPGNSYTTMTVDSSDSSAFITPQGTTASEVLLSSDQVSGASWFLYTEEGVDYYYVSVNFTDEGSATMFDLTNDNDADRGPFFNQTVSLWLDDRMLASPTVSEPITTGGMTFSGEFFTESKAKLYAAVISTGTLPCVMEAAYVGDVAPVAGDSASDLIFVTGIVALLAIAIVMILRYRLIGVAAVFAMLAEFSGLLAVITRFVGSGNTFLLTIPGAGALALSVLLTVLSCVFFGERAKSELNKGTVLGTAISAAIGGSRNKIFDINVILAIVSLIGMFMFGTAGLTSAIFGASAVSGVYNFCYVLFFGAVINFVAGYFLPQLMIRSFQSFNAFNKPSMFGGAK